MPNIVLSYESVATIQSSRSCKIKKQSEKIAFEGLEQSQTTPPLKLRHISFYQPLVS